MRNTSIGLLSLLLLGSGWQLTLYNSAQICARIADDAGQPIAKASVRLWLDTTCVATLQTDNDGAFCASVEPGAYTLEVDHEGFASLRIAQVVVSQNKKTNLRTVTLERAVPGLKETVITVYRPALFVNDDTASSSHSPILRPAHDERRGAPRKSHSRDLRPLSRTAPSERSLTKTPSLGVPDEATEGETPADLALPVEVSPVAVSASSESPKHARRPMPGSDRAGQLTAGEWNDLHNWNAHWTDLLRDGDIDQHQKTYQFFPKRRYSVILQNKSGMPLSDIPVQLLDRHGAILWEARTANTGQAELWEGLFDDKPADGPLKIVADVEGKTVSLGTPKPFEEGVNLHQIPRECRYARTVDIVWTIDATGSMGDEIDYLKTELLDVIGRVQERFPDLDLRMGSVFYRDEGDEYLVKSSALNRDISKTVDYIRRQHADGGGDYPEAVHTALEETLRQPWSREAVARICFLVLDASPHQRPDVVQSLQRSIREAARRGIRIVPIACSGIQKDTEFLLKFFGLATNGSYLFLTDHSGIGGKHLAPTADVYKVELLNDLLVRIIGEYVSTPDCNNGKTPVAFQTRSDPQSPTATTPPALYYPNPVAERLTLELPFDATKVTLYNAEGQAARDLGALPAGAHTILVKDLSPGTYTLRIWCRSEIQSGKVLVLRPS